MVFTKKTIIIGLCLCLVTVICCILFQNRFSVEKTNYIDNLNNSFLSSIYLEKDKRLESLNMPYAFVFVPEDENIQSTVVQRMESVVSVEKDTIDVTLSSNEKLNLAYQTYLFDKKPINLFELDSILQQELKKVSLYFTTAIKYIDNVNKDTIYSHDNPSLYKSSFATEPLTMGLRNEITLQAFADISPFMILGKAKSQFVAIGVTWLLTTSLLLLFAFEKEKVLYAILLTHKLRKKTKYKILRHMHMDSDKLLIRYKNKEIPLTNQLVQLMELFLNNPDHFVSYKIIVSTLYGNIEDPKDRISQTIKRLRRTLVDLPELEIRNIPNKGYQLIINNEVS